MSIILFSNWYRNVDVEEFKSIVQMINPSYHMVLAVLLAHKPADVSIMRDSDEAANQEALVHFFTEWSARQGGEANIRTGLAARLRHIGLSTQADCLLRTEIGAEGNCIFSLNW